MGRKEELKGVRKKKCGQKDSERRSAEISLLVTDHSTVLDVINPFSEIGRSLSVCNFVMLDPKHRLYF